MKVTRQEVMYFWRTVTHFGGMFYLIILTSVVFIPTMFGTTVEYKQDLFTFGDITLCVFFAVSMLVFIILDTMEMNKK